MHSTAFLHWQLWHKWQIEKQPQQNPPARKETSNITEPCCQSSQLNTTPRFHCEVHVEHACVFQSNLKSLNRERPAEQHSRESHVFLWVTGPTHCIFFYFVPCSSHAICHVLLAAFHLLWESLKPPHLKDLCSVKQWEMRLHFLARLGCYNRVPTVMANLKKSWTLQMPFSMPGKVVSFCEICWILENHKICPCPLQSSRIC